MWTLYLSSNQVIASVNRHANKLFTISLHNHTPYTTKPTTQSMLLPMQFDPHRGTMHAATSVAIY